MEHSITKDILKNELHSGGLPAIELLYNRYSGMLYSYILQFVPDKKRAESLLVDIFSGLHSRLEELFKSSLGIYCWLQVEARKIILDHAERHQLLAGCEEGEGKTAVVMQGAGDYFRLLEDASPEHRWIFRELYICGRRPEELAMQLDKDTAYVAGLLRESLLIISKKLG